MILADVLKYVFLVLGTLIVIVSYWLASTALFPQVVDRARAAYTLRPGRITVVGALVGIPLCVVGAAIINSAPHPVIKILGGALAALPIVSGLLGSAGLSERIGRGLVHINDAQSPWRRSMRGGIVLSFTFLLPVVGWFVVLPWTVLSGFGALLLGWRSPRAVDAYADVANVATMS